jgi:hypothetical protein
MVHGEHNRSKNSGGFALIIMGALLLFLAPQETTIKMGLGPIAWIAGIGIGSIGFYLKFFRWRVKKE